MAAQIPPISQPFLDEGGCVTLAWHRFLADLPKRMGGASNLTLSAQSDTKVRVTLVGLDGASRHYDITVA